MFFTRAGLEQATRAVVAERRAARLRAAGVRTLADLGCGLGADAIAAARAGIRVHGVEADPRHRRAWPPRTLRPRSGRTVHRGGRRRHHRSTCPGRRGFLRSGPPGTGTGRRVFDPAAYSPPWYFVTSLAERVPRTVLKVAPGIDHALLPPGAEAEWVSVDGDLVEATLWCGPLARGAPPRHAPHRETHREKGKRRGRRVSAAHRHRTGDRSAR